MPRKAQSDAEKTADSNIPRFAVKSGSGKKTLVGKIPIGTIPLAMLGDSLTGALEDAKKDGIEATHVRGTINLYTTEN